VGAQTWISDKGLMRMFGTNGNPRALNLFAAIGALLRAERVEFQVSFAKEGAPGRNYIAVDQRPGPQAWSTCATSHRIGSKLARAPARVMCGRTSGLRSIASKASRLLHCA
jgi:hypothetical protein